MAEIVSFVLFVLAGLGFLVAMVKFVLVTRCPDEKINAAVVSSWSIAGVGAISCGMGILLYGLTMYMELPLQVGNGGSDVQAVSRADFEKLSQVAATMDGYLKNHGDAIVKLINGMEQLRAGQQSVPYMPIPQSTESPKEDSNKHAAQVEEDQRKMEELLRTLERENSDMDKRLTPEQREMLKRIFGGMGKGNEESRGAKGKKSGEKK